MHYEAWPKEIATILNLSEREVRTSGRDLCVLINLAHKKTVYEPIFRKYSMRENHRVAQIPIKFKEAASLLSNQMSEGDRL